MARKAKTEDKRGSARVASADESGDAKQEGIRRRAHEIYERRKATGLPGDAEGDWLQAEAELGTHAKPRA